MEYIKKTLHALRRGKTCVVRSRSQAFQRPNALENSLLAKLPTEILGQIIDSLPTASAAIFSLSCRHVYLWVGIKYLERLTASSLERLEFLKLLEKDLPDQIVCDSCRNLHRTKDAKKYTYLGNGLEEPPCLTDNLETDVEEYINNNFNTTVFKMVMKHYRHFGKDWQCRQLLDLLSGSLIDNPYDFLHHREKATCRIQDGSLFTCKRIDTLGTCVSIERHQRTFCICPHISLVKERKCAILRIKPEHRSSPTTRKPAILRMNPEYPSSSDDKWEMFLLCDTSSWTIESEIQQCRWCRTEYMASFEHTRTCDVKLTVTIWKDLGQGLDAKPLKGHVPLPDIGWGDYYELDSDDRWRSDRDNLWKSESSWQSMKPVEIVKGEITSAFEKGWPGEDQE